MTRPQQSQAAGRRDKLNRLLLTLLFCRLAELTIFLEGNQSNLIEYDQWEELVRERLELMEVSNDIKIIGLYQKCYDKLSGNVLLTIFHCGLPDILK